MRNRTIPSCHPDRPHCARGMCKTCYKAAAYMAHQAERLAAAAIYRATHREELRIYDAARKEKKKVSDAARYAAHREERRAAAAIKRKAHPEREKASNEKWRAKNPEKVRIINARGGARWRAAHPEKAKEVNAIANAKWYAANTEKAKATNAKYCVEHPLARRVRVARRRALKLSAPGKPYTAREFRALCDESSWQCAYCAAVLDIVTVQADHIVPLSSGGSNGIENIAVSCGPCNRSKHNIPLDIWLERRRKVA